MFLRSAVLDLVRGAAGASMLLAVGCSSSEPIRQEPAATLAPLQVSAPPLTPPATLVPSAPIELTPVAPLPAAPTPAVTPARPRRPNRPAAPPPVVRQHPVSINELQPQPHNVHPNCGRG